MGGYGFRWGLFGLALAALLACGTASAETLQKLAISYNKTTSSGPIYIALEKGYFRDEGLDIQSFVFESASEPMVAVAAGSAQIACTPLSSAFYNIASRSGVVAIAGWQHDQPGYHNTALVVSPAAFEAGFKTLAGLKGRRIAITTTGGSGEYFLGRAAQQVGLSLSDITLVPLQNAPNILATLRGGLVDGFVLGSPNPAVAVSGGFGHVLAWTGDAVPSQFGVVMSNRSTIATHRGEIEKFLRAVGRGLADYHAAFNQRDAAGNAVKGPEFDALASLISAKIGVPVEKLGNDWPYVDLDLDAGDLAQQFTFWKKLNFLDKSIEPDVSKVVDQSFAGAR